MPRRLVALLLLVVVVVLGCWVVTRPRPRAPHCPLHLRGSLEVTHTQNTSLEDVEAKLARLVTFGGKYAPSGCQPRQKVAFILPYR